MKTKLKFLLVVAVIASCVMLFSCSEDEPAELTLVSLTANDIDLNGATTPNNVPINAVIVATFSTAVNPSSAEANIILTRDYDDAVVPLDIDVAGNVVTITPTASFGTGTLFSLALAPGLASTEGKTIAPAARTFTTEGTFAVAGAVAHWTFEDNANDVVGSFDPAASQVVGITYAASRNAASGKAASFNGATSIIEVSNGSALMNNGDWTLSFWVNASSVDKTTGHFVMGLGAFYGFQFEIAGNYSSCKLAASYAHTKEPNGTTSEDLWFPGDGKDRNNGGWQGWDFVRDLTTSGGVAGLLKDKWAHVVCMYNATTKQGVMYINGQRMKSQDFDLWPDGDAKQFVTGLKYRGVAPEVVNELAFGFIHSRAGTLWDAEPWGGFDQPTANHFKGLLDDIIIYHKPLSEAEIGLMYNSGKP
ncbi:MAG: Ig-like domain-containing protein [Cyclobacteriaceae bacterium]|jgi:hypothetical protein|nr:Ig-like domain-containing protein [Cyclobacteriaceae bacterium]